MTSILAFLSAHETSLLAGLFFLSEALALIPGIQANSVFQLVFGWLKSKQPSA